MAYAKINKSGCVERHGNVQVRIDFYLEPTDPRYNDTYIDVPVLDDKAEPTGKTKKQLNPFHSHFMYFSPDVTEAEILKEAEYHLPNFYTAFQNQWDKSKGGMRHGWATEKRIRPTRKDKTLKDYEAVRLSCEAKITELTEAFTSVNDLDGREYPATEIDIGSPAINRGAYSTITNRTFLLLENPANDTGVIDTIEIWANNTLSGTVVGTLYLDSGTTYIGRDYESIGTVASGSKQTFTGLDIDVETGDYIGSYATGGRYERDSSGYAGFRRNTSGNVWSGGSTDFTTLNAGYTLSIYGTGEALILPTVTTSAVSNINHNSAQANGNITDNGGAAPDERGFVYGTTSKADPGNTAPASSGYDSYENETGSYSAGTYNLTLTSLTADQTYYVRAYAHNSAGYAYGNEVSFTTAKAYNVSITTNLSLSSSVTVAKGKGVAITTNLSLSSSVTVAKGKGVAITTGLGLCVNDRTNYLITIPSDITKDVVDFPFVITENNIPSSFWSIAETDNLILRDVTGDLLYGELVTLDTVNHKLELYVKIPYAFEGISRSFYLSVGEGASLVGLTGTANAQNVWDENFVFVSHMNDQEGGTKIYDSTSNANHGTKGAGDSAPTEVDGLVGKAQDFSGSGKCYINLGGDQTQYNLLTATVEVLIQPNGANPYDNFAVVVGQKGNGAGHSSGAWHILQSRDSFNFNYYIYDDHIPDGELSQYQVQTRTLVDETWNYMANVIQGVGLKHGVALNDSYAEYTQTHEPAVRDGEQTRLGTPIYYNNFLNAETRISSTARGAGWISFTTSNLKNNSTSYSVTETSQSSPSRHVSKTRSISTDLSLTSIVTRTVNYAVRMAITNLSLNPIVTRTVNYTRSATTNLSFQSIVTAIKRGWVKVKLNMNNRSVKVKLHKRDIKLKIRRK